MIHRFGPFQYDSEQRLLFRGGETVQLGPKAIDTLHVLIERRGRIVEKAELMKLVWPDTVVEDVGLARNVSLLRKALGDDGVESSYIETVPRRGYRFAAVEDPPSQPVGAGLGDGGMRAGLAAPEDPPSQPVGAGLGDGGIRVGLAAAEIRRRSRSRHPRPGGAGFRLPGSRPWSL